MNKEKFAIIGAAHLAAMTTKEVVELSKEFKEAYPEDVEIRQKPVPFELETLKTYNPPPMDGKANRRQRRKQERKRK